MISVDIRALLNRLNAHCTQALEAAAGACLSRAHYEVTVEHLLSKLLESPQNDLNIILRHFSCNREALSGAVNETLEKLRSGNSGKPVFSPLLLEWLEGAWLLVSVDLHQESIRSGALVLAMLGKPERLAYGGIVHALQPVSRDALQSRFFEIVKGSAETPAGSEVPASEVPAGGTTALGKYCTDFTRKAQADEIDPVFGRDREIYQMIDILARRRKNNPILVGEAGVGKTAVVEGLALRIIRGSVPDALKGISIMGLDMGLLQAGSGIQGEFENRLKAVIQEIKSSPKPLILFIDEAHTLIGAGGPAGGSDAANLLKPALARGELRTIAATTWAEYKKYFEKDSALARRFQPVKLDEPSVSDTILILRGLKSRYEKAHGVVVRDSAIVAAAEQSSRYISGRQLPDKAVDLLDTSAARVKVLLTAKPVRIEDREREIESLGREKEGAQRDTIYGDDPKTERIREIDQRLAALQSEIKELNAQWHAEKAAADRLIGLRKELYALSPQGEQTEKSLDLRKSMEDAARQLKALQGPAPLVLTDVDPDLVAKVVSDWTGIPLGKLLRDEAENILKLEPNLTERIRGQEQAVSVVSRTLRSSKAGLTDPQQPLGVFLLVGPSGVGKTETALAVADLLFGGERFLVTINMSEFQESHSVSRLIGSPPGYVGYGEGGILTEAVRQKPYSVILIDEAEKAHLDVMNLLYQVFDKGALSDAEGRIVDFKNTVLFLTSNLAADTITRLCAADSPPPADAALEAIRPTLSHHFKPALLARMTVVPYYSLAAAAMKDIVIIKMNRLVTRLFASHRMKLLYSDAVIDQIAARCLEVETGARNIDHIMRGTLLPQMSQVIVARMGADKMPAQMQLGVNTDGSFSLS